MPYDTHLENRIDEVLKRKKIKYESKKMMGGLCYMVDDKMCVGIVKDTLMARIGVDQYEDAVSKPGIHPMDFTGRPMKGYIFASPEAVDMEEDLEYWIQLALNFNPLAKSSKRKKKKN